MKAVVMAGGFGSRLYPLTVNQPKPMVPLVDKPALAHILNLLKKHGFNEVVLTVRYLAHQIQEHFGDGQELGLKLHYALEDVPLGTAGGVKNDQHYLDNEPFLVISGDALTDIDLTQLVQLHQTKQAMATLALKQVENPGEYGVVLTDKHGQVRQYREKPGNVRLPTTTVNTGIYVMEPGILERLSPQVAYDFSTDVFPQLLAENMPVFGHVVGGYWRDIGTLQSYVQAVIDIFAGKVNHIDLGDQVGHQIWLGKNVQIAPNVTIRGPVYIGSDVKIRQGAKIFGPSVIGPNTIIDREARIERSVIGQNCFIGRAVRVRHTIVAAGSERAAPRTVRALINPHHVAVG